MYLPECFDTMGREEQADFLADELLDVCVHGVPVPWAGPHYDGMVAAGIIGRIKVLAGMRGPRLSLPVPCGGSAAAEDCPW